jgi:hypothetical protein
MSNFKEQSGNQEYFKNAGDIYKYAEREYHIVKGSRGCGKRLFNIGALNRLNLTELELTTNLNQVTLIINDGKIIDYVEESW